MAWVQGFKRTWLPLVVGLTAAWSVVGLVILWVSGQNNDSYRPWVNDITEEDSALLDGLLDRNDPALRTVLANPDRYRLQIIFTQVNRNRNNKPFLKHHTWRLDTLEYFYPASMVKLPTAALTLEKLNRLNIEGLDAYTRMEVNGGTSACHRQTTPSEVSTTWGHACLAHYIKDALVASGNVAYDRIYEFVGQQELNETLHERGYTSANITQRYGAYCSLEENRYTQRIRFYGPDGKLVYDQPPQRCTINFQQKTRMRVGRAKKLADGTIVDEPYDFTGRNFIHLKDLHEILMAIMMPQAMPRKQLFRLRRDDFQLLHRYMSMYPTESTDPLFDRGYYTTTRMKYLLYGNAGSPDPNVRIFNKVGMAHGFLVDCAYIVDFEKRVEFFVSAMIFTNRNGIMGEGNYEYYSLGMPFLKRLGQILLDNERLRLRKYEPDLDFYRHDYSGY
jgi:hypothetical protein